MPNTNPDKLPTTKPLKALNPPAMLPRRLMTRSINDASIEMVLLIAKAVRLNGQAKYSPTPLKHDLILLLVALEKKLNGKAIISPMARMIFCNTKPLH